MSTVNSTITVTIPMLLTNSTLAGLGLHWKSWRSAATWCTHSACPGYWSRWLFLLGQWHHLPTMLCSLLALARPEVTVFGTDAGACGGCSWRGRLPASASFLIACVQYRLISSKEPIYKQQLHIFKFPFVQFNKTCIHISLLNFSTTGYQFSSLYYLIDIYEVWKENKAIWFTMLIVVTYLML